MDACRCLDVRTHTASSGPWIRYPADRRFVLVSSDTLRYAISRSGEEIAVELRRTFVELSLGVGLGRRALISFSCFVGCFLVACTLFSGSAHPHSFRFPSRFALSLFHFVSCTTTTLASAIYIAYRVSLLLHTASHSICD